MSKTMIIVEKGYRIHPRYSSYGGINYVDNPDTLRKFVEEHKIDFRLLIFTYNKTHKKTYVLVDVNKLKWFKKYEKYKQENKRIYAINVNEARKYEADKEKRVELKSLCEAAEKHDGQDSFKKDPRIKEIGNNEYEFIEDDDISSPSSDQDDESSRTIWGKLGSEGKLRLEKEHYVRERNPKIRKEKIKDVRKKQKKLSCEICRIVEGGAGYPLDFRAEKIAEKMFEVHHIKPFAKIEGEVDPELENYALLCANCHRMVHAEGLDKVERNLKKLQNHYNNHKT